MKQIPKHTGGRSARSPKLPDELIPIVDAVVDVVFQRLRSATTTQSLSKGPPLSSKPARLNLPLPKQRTALAEALADLLLADLASKARTNKRKPKRVPAKPRRKPAKPPSRRGTTPPKSVAREVETRT